MTEIERAAKVVGYLTWDREIDGAPAFESAALDWLAEHSRSRVCMLQWLPNSRLWVFWHGGGFTQHRSRASALASAVLAVQEKAK